MRPQRVLDYRHQAYSIEERQQLVEEKCKKLLYSLHLFCYASSNSIPVLCFQSWESKWVTWSLTRLSNQLNSRQMVLLIVKIMFLFVHPLCSREMELIFAFSFFFVHRNIRIAQYAQCTTKIGWSLLSKIISRQIKQQDNRWTGHCEAQDAANLSCPFPRPHPTLINRYYHVELHNWPQQHVSVLFCNYSISYRRSYTGTDISRWVLGYWQFSPCL